MLKNNKKPIQHPHSANSQKTVSHTQTATKTIQLAMEHHQKGNLPEAERLYRIVLKTNPNNAEANYLLGTIAHQAGDNDKAILLIKKAISINPNSAEAYNNLGNVFINTHRLNEAIAAYKKAVSINSKFALAYNNLGVALKEANRLDEAIASFHNALSIIPNFVQCHQNLGDIFAKTNQLDKAITSYRKALSFRPDLAEIHNRLGIVFKTANHLDKAIKCYKKALVINPNFAEAYLNLANAFRKKNQYHEAVINYKNALSLKPDFTDAYNNLGVVLKETHQIDKAITCYKKALSIQPGSAGIHNNIGIVLKTAGRLNEAIFNFQAAVRIDPANLEYWANFSDCVGNTTFTSYDNGIAKDLLIMLNQPSVCPRDLSQAITGLLLHHPTISRLVASSELPVAVKDIDQLIRHLSDISLLLRLMELCILSDLKVEHLFTQTRAAMLKKEMEIPFEIGNLKFYSALAMQCFINEFVLYETEEEKKMIGLLEKRIEAIVQDGKFPFSSSIAILACYRPLNQYIWSEKLAKLPYRADINKIITIQIKEIKEEADFKAQISCLGLVNDQVSRNVQKQYEENPYPRWIKTGINPKPQSIINQLKHIDLHPDVLKGNFPEKPEILIAGCGTGQHAITTATTYLHSNVLGIDLSRSSIAYAMRKTRELNITNIRYIQGDILDLKSLGRQFDIIESSGVLHHMADPMAGWEVLADLLRKGGLMKIGLYSKIAREPVTAIRKMIAQQNITYSIENLRKLRKEIVQMNSLFGTFIKQVTRWGDFYSTSSCRDLIFHVSEHLITLPQIKHTLEKFNLKFLGFEFPNNVIKKRFIKSNPQESALYSLSLWHDFEKSNPSAFSSMYQFWIQKQ